MENVSVAQNESLASECQKLWKIAENFRAWVCDELKTLSIPERNSLRGDYLFVIDNKPRFVVMIDEQGAWSVSITLNNAEITYSVDSDCPWEVTHEQLSNVLEHSARVRVYTDSSTLYKLLLGTLRARIAFVTSKVNISGDLSAFLKMISILKRKGVDQKRLVLSH